MDFFTDFLNFGGFDKPDRQPDEVNEYFNMETGVTTIEEKWFHEDGSYSKRVRAFLEKPVPKEENLQEKIDELQEELNKTVDEQNYEHAVYLRNKIIQLKKDLKEKQDNEKSNEDGEE